MSKRTISLLLTVVLLFGMLPVTALAENADTTAEVDTSDVSIEGTNGFGTLLSEDIAEAQAAEEEAYDTGYSVTDLVIAGNTASVTYDTMEEATLVVAVYTEDGMQMLNSGKTTVFPDSTEATVTIEGDMPEYFMASAFLLDTYDFSPLCKSYSTPMYTQEMQELLASTVEDYEADRILNLDDDDTTNFAVYAEDTIVIEEQEGVNTVASVDDETSTYVIENADESITSLVEGDVFAYPYGEYEILIVKVASISVDGTTVTITGSELEMEEVFQAAKIEGTSSNEDMTVDMSTADEGISYAGLVQDDAAAYALEGEGSANAKHRFPIEIKAEADSDHIASSLAVEGSLDVGINVSLKYYISLSRAYIEFKATPELKLSVAVEGKITVKQALGKLGVSPVPGVYVGFSPELQLEFEGKTEVYITLSTTIGVKCDTSSEITNLSKSPDVDMFVDVEGTIFFGVDFCPNVSILGNSVAELKLNAVVGLELKGEMQGMAYELLDHDADTRHMCNECLAIDLKFKAELTGRAEFLKQDWLSVTVDIGKWSKDLGKAYYRFDDDLFGWGECPYKEYRVTVEVRNTTGLDNAVCFNGHYYKMYNGQASWEDAAAFCQSVGGHLATITSKEENAFLHDYLVALGVSGAYFGFSDASTEGVWEWCTGEDVTFTNWGTGEPNNQGRAEHYGLFDFSHSGGKWNDGSYKSGANTYFVCEWDVVDSLSDENKGALQSGITVTANEESAQTNENGVAQLWLPLGYCTVEAANSAETITGRTGVFVESPCKSTITVMEKTGGENGGTGDSSGSGSGFGGIWGEVDSGEITDQGAVVASGTCGNNLIWTLDNNGTLTISGTGAMEDYEYGGSPWSSVRGQIKTAIIKSGVTTIGGSAFRDCTSLTSVATPNSVTSISSAAFMGCTNLTSVTIPDSVTYIGGSAFRDCTSLTSVTIPNSVTTIDNVAFSGCTSLTAINVLSDNTAYKSIGGVLFNKAETTILQYPGGKSGAYTIPDGVTSIQLWAFASCGSLTSVTIPNSVTTIGARAFDSCRSLPSVTIPDSVTSIGTAAFYNCTSLTSVTIPDSVTSIGDWTFDYCSSLTSVTIPDSVITIGVEAFSKCTSLTSVTIGDSVTTIGDSAFSKCTSLTSVMIPDSVTTIGNFAFENCTSLASVTIPDSVATIGWVTFAGCTSLTDVYYSGTEEQWNAIDIGTDNSSLDNATIHYNSTGPVVTASELSFSQDAPVLYSINGGEYGTEVTDTYTLKTASFTDLVPGQEYTLLAMVSIEVEDVLSADNLLYIDQSVAKEDGTLEFQYIQRTPTDVSYVMACGASNKNLKDAKITFPEMIADGELQVVDPTVVYDGKTLTEGVDYIIVGTVYYTAEGEYTCTIRGIYNYTGLVECTYTVNPHEHSYENSVCTVCGAVLSGDVNLDGRVDIADMFQAKNLILAKAWTNAELDRGDLNENGKLEVTDIIAIKNIILSKE